MSRGEGSNKRCARTCATIIAERAVEYFPSFALPCKGGLAMDIFASIASHLALGLSCARPCPAQLVGVVDNVKQVTARTRQPNAPTATQFPTFFV